jgi:GNAT superfamily N-acetyltransferase
MLRYKINKISSIETNALSDFYKKVYYERHKSLTNNWKWWYRAGYNKFEPLILSINEKVIGQAGLLPVDLNILDRKTSAIWFIDFAILPEFQGKGYGKILTEEWMKICPNQITFCNNLSLKVFKKFGWKNNLLANRLVKPINVLKILPMINKFEFNFLNQALRYFIEKKYKKNVSINPYKIEENFGTIKNSFKLQKFLKSKNYAQIIRDEEWLNWRLIECPYKKDIYFFENKNSFAIVHIFLNKNIKKLNVLYTYSTDKLETDELLVLILNWAIKNNIDLIWAISRDKNFNNFFPKLLNKPINFASWSSDKEISNILFNGLMNPQGIDSDIDSNLYIE